MGAAIDQRVWRSIFTPEEDKPFARDCEGERTVSSNPVRKTDRSPEVCKVLEYGALHHFTLANNLTLCSLKRRSHAKDGFVDARLTFRMKDADSRTPMAVTPPAKR